MPGERLLMRKIRELLRLRWEQHLPQRVIANSLGLSQGAVSDYLNRATSRWGWTWPAAGWVGRHAARGAAFSVAAGCFRPISASVPDWSAVHRGSASAGQRDPGTAVGGIPCAADNRQVRLLVICCGRDFMLRASE